MIFLNLFHLRYFVKLAHEQHYTRAAEKLCITQPSLSNAISQLEHELGVPLFDKSSRKTKLTVFGEQFLSCVESCLNTLDQGIESLQLAAKGDGLIRLGLLRTLGIEYIPNLIASYLKEHPDRDIRFTLETDMTQRLLKGLEEQRLDIVFSSPPASPDNFDTVAVSRQDLVLIVPKDHPLASRHVIDLRETLEYPYVHFKKDAGLRAVIDGLFQKIGTQPEIAYEIDEDQVIAGMVAAGFGIAVVPYMELLHRLNVKIIQISYPVWERNFYMVTNPESYLPPVVENFRQYVIDHYSI